MQHILFKTSMNKLLVFFLHLSLIGIILRWGFLIWELIFIIFIFYLFLINILFYCFYYLFIVSKVPGDHCQKIAVSNPTQACQRFTWSKTWCDRQQQWKAVITGDTVTRLIIPIWGRGKSPEEGQRWNLAETLWKKKQHKNYQDEEKVRNK